MKLLALLAFASVARCQTSSPPSFILLEGQAAASTTPKPGACGVYGTPIASDKLSWSSYCGGILKVAGKPQITTTATTGIAQRVANFSLGSWQCYGWIIGALGPGQTGSVTSLALNAGGGITAYPKKWQRLFFYAGFEQLQIAGKSQGQVQLGVGRRL